jgi:hypothetical protein
MQEKTPLPKIGSSIIFSENEAVKCRTENIFRAKQIEMLPAHVAAVNQ